MSLELWLLLAVAAVIAAGACTVHRRNEVRAWERELAVAFQLKERREVPPHRRL